MDRHIRIHGQTYTQRQQGNDVYVYGPRGGCLGLFGRIFG